VPRKYRGQPRWSTTGVRGWFQGDSKKNFFVTDGQTDVIDQNSVVDKVFSQTTFITQYLSNLNPEGEVFSSIIDGFTDSYISKLKWAWQAHFLSYVLLILRLNSFFEDKHMILLSLFDISTGFRFQKNPKSFPIQVWSHL